MATPPLPKLHRRHVIITALAAGAVGSSAAGRSMAQETVEVLLQVKSADGRVVGFDLPALDALRQYAFQTTTSWTEGVQQFSGPPLAAVLDAARIPLGTVLATAENDYAANLTFPPGDDLVPIIATRIGDREISRREKGPLWIVFPYDSDPVYRTATALSQSVWQIVALSADPADLL